MQERRFASTRVLQVLNCGTVIERRGHFYKSWDGLLAVWGASWRGPRFGALLVSAEGRSRTTARPPFRPASRPWGECARRRQSALSLQSAKTAAQHRRARVNDTAVYGSHTDGSPSLRAPLGSRFFRAVNRSLRSARLRPFDRSALRSSRLALIGASESGCRASNPCCCLIR